MVAALTAAALASAILHLRADYLGPRWQEYLFKPLTTALLVVLAAAGSAEPRYRIAITAGLLLSLAGDVFLMLPGDRFIPGLVSFLLAHLAYLIAFTAGTPFGAVPWVFLPYAAVGAILIAILWPSLGGQRVPVAVYVAVILAMAAQAAIRAAVMDTNAAALAAGGAALFVVSDAVLAFARFRKPFRAAQAVIMSTYVVAQWLIALSA